MADEVLQADGRALPAGEVALGGEHLVDEDEAEAADRAGVLVDGVVVDLGRQLAGRGQVADDLAQVGVHALVHLVAQVQVHAEDVVGPKGLDRVGERVRLVGHADAHEPPGAGALGVLVQDRVHDVAVDVTGVGVLGEEDEVVGAELVALVLAQARELGQVAADGQQRRLALLDGSAQVPTDHDAHDEGGEQQREVAAVEELGEGGGEEETLEHEEEDDEDPRGSLEPALARQVEEQKDGRAHHRDRDSQAVCGLHVRGALEEKDHDDAAHEHDRVDHGDVELALGLGGVGNLHVGHEVEAHRLGHEREGAGDEGLGRDDGRERGEAHGEGAQARVEHLEERVEVGDARERRVGGVQEQPSALAQVGEEQADLHERPGGVDVVAAHVAHV